MGKQKQQVISRFFAPKSRNTDTDSSTCSSSQPQSIAPSSSSEIPKTPPSKITATVSFSPARRLLSPCLNTPPTKRPKLSPHTQNPIPSISPSLHQKFLSKLLEPPTSLPESSSQTQKPQVVKYTPLEEQVVDLKNKYSDVLLMIEVGYRYRFFGKDAEIAARVLGIYAHMDHNFLTASVPTFRLNVHVRRLVNAGYKVGVVKQTETAAIKAHGDNKSGPFCRGLTALYTKATLEAAEDVGGREEGCGGDSNYMACVVERGVGERGMESGVDARIAVVAVEISTGDVVYGEFDDCFLRIGLEAVILSLRPVELLLREPLSKQSEKLLLAYAGTTSMIRVEHIAQDCFNDGGALAEVVSAYEKMNTTNLQDQLEENIEVVEHGDSHSAIEGVMNMPDLAVQALALTIRHFKQFGFERILCQGASFRPLSTDTEMNLSANTLQQLEILKNCYDGSEPGSLLQHMNHTLTIYGARLLKHWVTHPLCDRNMIRARLDAVSEIAESMGSCKDLQNTGGADDTHSDVTTYELTYLLSLVLTSLGRSSDLQRGITRIFHGTANASEFIAVIQAILYAGKQLQQVNIGNKDGNEKGVVKSVLLRRLISTASSSSIISSAAKLLSMLNREAAEKGDILNLLVISDGQFPEVAKARKAVQETRDKLESLINIYRKQLRMHKLEFKSVSEKTHLIELPLDIKVPSNWVKVNSTKKNIRYHPPEVVTALDQLSLMNEELSVVCRTAWDSFLRGFSGYYGEFLAAVQALAALDCLHSLALLSRNKNYVRPVFVDDEEPVQIHICAGRHPVLETILQDNFVPNDTYLHAEKEYCQIVTGPNMGGKSCYIRQVALVAVMAQVGSFVPASSAKLHVLDGIFTRMGASDNIQQGRSTFLEELSEASHILHKSTSRSLVIIDELGRGTSTHDGVAIAYATLYHLLEHKRGMILFVTHYPKIADIRSAFPGSIGAYHVSYLTSHENSGIDSNSDYEDITYLYKLVPGICSRSFGLKVAQLAQLPLSCIGRAAVMAARLEAELSNRVKERLGKEILEVRPLIQGCHHIEVDNFEVTRVYRECFSNLRLALLNDDLEKRTHLLKQAWNVAKEFIGSSDKM